MRRHGSLFSPKLWIHAGLPHRWASVLFLDLSSLVTSRFAVCLRRLLACRPSGSYLSDYSGDQKTPWRCSRCGSKRSSAPAELLSPGPGHSPGITDPAPGPATPAKLYDGAATKGVEVLAQRAPGPFNPAKALARVNDPQFCDRIGALGRRAQDSDDARSAELASLSDRCCTGDDVDHHRCLSVVAALAWACNVCFGEQHAETVLVVCQITLYRVTR